MEQRTSRSNNNKPNETIFLCGFSSSLSSFRFNSLALVLAGDQFNYPAGPASSRRANYHSKSLAGLERPWVVPVCSRVVAGLLSGGASRSLELLQKEQLVCSLNLQVAVRESRACNLPTQNQLEARALMNGSLDHDEMIRMRSEDDEAADERLNGRTDGRNNGDEGAQSETPPWRFEWLSAQGSKEAATKQEQATLSAA